MDSSIVASLAGNLSGWDCLDLLSMGVVGNLMQQSVT